MPFNPNYEIPAGTLKPAVVGTPISAADWNAFITDLQTALTDTLRATTQAFVGQVFFDDTAPAGAPAIAFTADTDTGIFQKGANELGFATGGNERVLVTDTLVTVTDDLYATGDIGTAANLDVAGTGLIGGLLTANAGITCNAQKIAAVLDPTADQDAATKKYVDDSVVASATAWVQPTAAADCVTTLLRTRKVNGQVQFNGSISFTGVVNSGDNLVTTGHAPWSVISGNYTTVYALVLAHNSVSGSYAGIPAIFTANGGELNIRLAANNMDANMTIYLDDMTYYAG
jgi:hypothetical protein